MNQDKKNSDENFNNEDSIDKLFSEVKDGKMAKILRKNKILSYLKTAIISTIVTVIVLFAGYVIIITLNGRYCNSQRMSNGDELTECFSVGYPNRFIGEYNHYAQFFKGEIECTTYKNIGGRILYAGVERRLYGFLSQPTEKMWGGMVCQQTTDESISVGIQNRQSSTYGLRYMTFFYPYVEYKNGINDFLLLDQIQADKIVEIGLSFDKAYTYNEVKQYIPENLATFYWVDTKSQSQKARIMGNKYAAAENDINGMKLIHESGNKMSGDPIKPYIQSLIWFKENVKNSKYSGFNEYSAIYDTIAGSDGKVDESDIKIIGAVLVGSSADISSLKDKPFIKYATLGSVVDKY